MLLDILVPLPGTQAARIIAPGSAVVGSTASGGVRHVYFEGAIYRDAGAAPSFREKLENATGRLVTRYPTIAQGRFDASDFEVVGQIDGTRFTVTTISDVQALATWSGEAPEALLPVQVPTGKFIAGSTVTDETLRRELKRAYPLSDHRNKGIFYWCQLPGGQICRHDMNLGTTEIFDFDTPGLRAQMENAGFPPNIIARACGAAIPAESQQPVMGR
jgi:hypothetical protein